MGAGTLTAAQMAGMTSTQLANWELGQLGESAIDITGADSGAGGSGKFPPPYTVNPFTGETQSPGVTQQVTDSLGLAVQADSAAAGAVAEAAGTGLKAVGSTIGQTLSSILSPLWWVLVLAAAALVAYLWLAR
jgi:hypothetical protein